MIEFFGWYIIRKEEFERRIERAEKEFVPLLGCDEKIILMSRISAECEKRQKAEQECSEARAMYAEEVEKRYNLARKLAQMEKGEETNAV